MERYKKCCKYKSIGVSDYIARARMEEFRRRGKEKIREGEEYSFNDNFPSHNIYFIWKYHLISVETMWALGPKEEEGLASKVDSVQLVLTPTYWSCGWVHTQNSLNLVCIYRQPSCCWSTWQIWRDNLWKFCPARNPIVNFTSEVTKTWRKWISSFPVLEW